MLPISLLGGAQQLKMISLHFSFNLIERSRLSQHTSVFSTIGVPTKVDCWSKSVQISNDRKKGNEKKNKLAGAYDVSGREASDKVKTEPLTRISLHPLVTR